MIRRAMSKKKHAVIDAERVAFVRGDPKRDIPGALANGVSEAVANSIYDEILDFASYAFNKAHAVSYAIVAYRTAYMKRHHPREYMAALLTSVLENSAKVAEYIAECRELGIRLLPPDVNESEANFTVSGGNIRFGLVAIKGIGWGVINGLVAERELGGPFRSFEEFCRRMAGKDINRRAIDSLIRSGAFDSLGCRRRALVQIAGPVIDSVNRAQKENIDGQFDLFGDGAEREEIASIPIPDVEEYTAREKMAMEKEATGLYLSGHPMDEYRDTVRRIGAAKIGPLMADFAQTEGQHRYADGQYVTLAGVISSARTRTTKNNSLMSYVVLEDDSGSMELIVFQKTLDACGAFIRENEIVIAKGRISARDEKEPQLMCDSIRPIADAAPAGSPAKEQGARKLYVKLPSREDKRLRHLELVLKMFPGSDQMVIWCEREQKRIGAKCQLHEVLLDELREVFGEDNVVVK